MTLTQQQVDEVRRLSEQQDAARQRAVTAAVALAVARTRDFDQWYSTAAITTWAASIVLAIEAIQRNLARQTDAMMARQSTVMTGRTIRPVGAVDVTRLRQGVTHAGVYGRVADTYRYQQSLVDAGQKVQPALEAAVQRAEAAAETDAKLVVRAQSQKFLTAQPVAADVPPPLEPDETTPPETSVPPAPARRQARVVGYRRVVHPELSAGGSCGMCIVASHRLYNIDDLMPLHDGCNCLPMPVYEGADPGAIINDADLERFYAEAGGKQFEELGRTRYQIQQNGELGPVLTLQGAAFRTADDVARDETH